MSTPGPTSARMGLVTPHARPPAPLIYLLGMAFENTTIDRAADALVADAAAGVNRRVFFVNAHCVNVAHRDEAYAHALACATTLYADGAGMAIAARLFGIRLADNVNGTDLFPLLCERAAANEVPIALLGARPGIAQRCAERMRARYPALRITFSHHGYFDDVISEHVIRRINESGARILLVAQGVPQQEIWIARNAHRLAAPVLLGVGALFDFYSGAIPRAPGAIRRLRLEWVFRLAMEPRRLGGRYLAGNPLFLARVLARRFSRANDGP